MSAYAVLLILLFCGHLALVVVLVGILRDLRKLSKEIEHDALS